MTADDAEDRASRMISEDDCPFTEDELRRGLALLYPPDQASALASEIAEGGRTQRTKADAAAAIARGSRDPMEINPQVMIIPDEFFAAVASLSPELTDRCEAWRRRMRREARAHRERQAMFRAGHRHGAPLTPEVSAELAREDAEQDASWRRIQTEVATHAAGRHLPFQEP